MTSTVNEFTRMTLDTTSYDVLSAIVGAAAIGLLLVFLIEKEVVRVVGRPWSKRSQQVLNSIVAPLLVAFVTIVALRFAIDVLHYRWG
jgi:NhaP-type Na+/H+ or K+/H+ antiporter